MKFEQQPKAIVLLADGTVFYGNILGNTFGIVEGEICFTTAMTGYEDFFLDPAYYGKIVVSAAPHVGGYGVKKEEIQWEDAVISGLITRNFAEFYSRNAADGSLQDYLEDSNVMILTNVDTRALISHLRENGSMPCIITSEVENIDYLKERLKNKKGAATEKKLSEVSVSERKLMGNPDSKFKISVLDLGIKKSILKQFINRDCHLEIFPFDSSVEAVIDSNPHGFLIAGGPGNPMEMKDPFSLVKELLKLDKPVFAIGTGHNLVGRAYGIDSVKLKTGHHGANHPVKNIITGKGEITVKNQDYVLNSTQFKAQENLELTHIDLNDQSIAGMRIKDKNLISVQYFLGGQPGPTDSDYLFDEFIELLKH